MREFIIHKKTQGYLTFEENRSFWNVICEYDDDYYSDKNSKGTFRISDTTTETENFFRNYPLKFTFRDKFGLNINGVIEGINIKDSEFFCIILTFRIYDLSTREIYSRSISKLIRIKFKTPYIDLFARNLLPSHGLTPNFIIKFNSDEFILKINNQKIIFKERINFLKYTKPDSIFNRILEPYIEEQIEDTEDIAKKINGLLDYMKSIFPIISFVLNKWLGCFGANIELLTDNKSITEIIEYKEFYNNCGDDYINSTYDENFRGFFTEENLSRVICGFINQEPTLRTGNKQIYFC